MHHQDTRMKLWDWLRTKVGRPSRSALSSDFATTSRMDTNGPTTMLMQDSRLMQDLAQLHAENEEDEANAKEAAGGLDFVAAIRVHQAWRGRLTALIDKPTKERLSARQVARDDLCDLGQWLQGPGRRLHGTDPLLNALTSAHSRFHYLAAQVLYAAQMGHSEQAKQILNTDYHLASVRLQGKLAELFVKIETHEALGRNQRYKTPVPEHLRSARAWMDTQPPGTD
ncbi:hypothetical protein VITFI_CDS1326 [Vitreoscilla filiformis]|uniref:Chemoreceptor zinc-binding domain-containing protein n=2 Tax=Vitreoscilla filiformis TaxID=63 RepID=A0A221KDI7_VITFI|nr:hypothetical protein VITFI_CDS1326 [Vitreoscilla filiformis]